MKIRFEAFDGTVFSDEAHCKVYERLIEQTKNNKFLSLSQSLFAGLTYRTQDDYQDEVFNLSQIQKFTTNLVKALPQLQAEFQRVLDEIAKKPEPF